MIRKQAKPEDHRSQNGMAGKEGMKVALSSAEQIRRWRGPAILTNGFRPFFLLGSVWAGIAMIIWIMALSGSASPPSRFDPISWHAHAFVFGYLSAIIAGFLLTAVPNWTGRLPVVGWRLAALAGLWTIGRAAVFASAHLSAAMAAALDLLFPIALGLLIFREIFAGKNWRNLITLSLLAVFTLANLIFHLEAARGLYPAHGMGLRLGLAAILMMIAVIGGRIIPSFTRNWLAQRGATSLPVPPMQRFDRAILLFSAATLLGWVVFPEAFFTGIALLIVAIGHFFRLLRWKGIHTGPEPLVAILHLAYFFLPLGALAVGFAILWPELVEPAAAMHLWLAGATGTMTLAVMTRATLGHTGHELHADLATVMIYAAIIGASLIRFLAGFFPLQILFDISGTLWCLAFFGYAGFFGHKLLSPRR
jgi:uncharacterized protein involved in response to NO